MWKWLLMEILGTKWGVSTCIQIVLVAWLQIVLCNPVYSVDQEGPDILLYLKKTYVRPNPTQLSNAFQHGLSMLIRWMEVVCWEGCFRQEKPKTDPLFGNKIKILWNAATSGVWWNLSTGSKYLFGKICSLSFPCWNKCSRQLIKLCNKCAMSKQSI